MLHSLKQNECKMSIKQNEVLTHTKPDELPDFNEFIFMFITDKKEELFPR